MSTFNGLFGEGTFNEIMDLMQASNQVLQESLKAYEKLNKEKKQGTQGTKAQSDDTCTVNVCKNECGNSTLNSRMDELDRILKDLDNLSKEVDNSILKENVKKAKEEKQTTDVGTIWEVQFKRYSNVQSLMSLYTFVSVRELKVVRKSGHNYCVHELGKGVEEGLFYIPELFLNSGSLYERRDKGNQFFSLFYTKKPDFLEKHKEVENEIKYQSMGKELKSLQELQARDNARMKKIERQFGELKAEHATLSKNVKDRLETIHNLSDKIQVANKIYGLK